MKQKISFTKAESDFIYAVVKVIYTYNNCDLIFLNQFFPGREQQVENILKQLDGLIIHSRTQNIMYNKYSSYYKRWIQVVNATPKFSFSF